MSRAKPLILILCTGNVCRSPMAEALMRSVLVRRNISAEVESRGLAAAVGRAPHPYALQTASDFGAPIAADKRAGSVTSAELRIASLVLVMDKMNYHRVHKVFPQASGKTFLLGRWQAELEIPDPIAAPEETFRAQWALMRTACEAWVEHLLQAGMLSAGLQHADS
ncbi:MAG: low molecular weight phosphotyrosine protein phosphatase [Burkholderiaceae bacterium]|nr:MAG: low molecular weight phosphotyrosine protein phosphatase [Burkholderiaceae bacterium]